MLKTVVVSLFLMVGFATGANAGCWWNGFETVCNWGMPRAWERPHWRDWDREDWRERQHERREWCEHHPRECR